MSNPSLCGASWGVGCSGARTIKGCSTTISVFLGSKNNGVSGARIAGVPGPGRRRSVTWGIGADCKSRTVCSSCKIWSAKPVIVVLYCSTALWAVSRSSTVSRPSFFIPSICLVASVCVAANCCAIASFAFCWAWTCVDSAVI